MKATLARALMRNACALFDKDPTLLYSRAVQNEVFSMALRMLAALLLAVLPLSGLAGATERSAAVLLLPESDMDRELADDLTEVLISSVIEKSNRGFRVQGKETFRNSLSGRTAKSGATCVSEVACVREAATEMAIDLVLFGKVGKAANGYRLEVWLLATGAAKEKPYRQMVEGDVGKLIEEMEQVAKWALRPRTATLVFAVKPAGATITLDGKAVIDSSKPASVGAGKHVVAATAEGFEAGEVTIDCTTKAPCEAKLTLVKVAGDPPIGPIDPPPKTGHKESSVSSGTIVATSLLGGVALLAGGGSIYMYTRMKQAETDANNLIDEYCPNGTDCNVDEETFFEEFDPIVDNGNRDALISTVLAGVAGASAVAAVTILVIDIADGPDAKASKTAFQPHFSPDFTGATFGVTF